MIDEEKYLNADTDTVLCEFTGKSIWTLFDSYTTTVKVFFDHVEVVKEGRTGDVPPTFTIFFEHLISVNCYKSFDYPGAWLSFSTMGGAQGGQSIGMVNVGKFAIGSAIANPWSDPYSINFKRSNYESVQSFAEEINSVFNLYRKHKSNLVVKESESALDKLKKLKELLELGILSQAEYEEKKQKLMSEI